MHAFHTFWFLEWFYKTNCFSFQASTTASPFVSKASDETKTKAGHWRCLGSHGSHSTLFPLQTKAGGTCMIGRDLDLRGHQVKSSAPTHLQSLWCTPGDRNDSFDRTRQKNLENWLAPAFPVPLLDARCTWTAPRGPCIFEFYDLTADNKQSTKKKEISCDA